MWGWGGWGRRWGWVGPWPGRGPFSFLPPWLRPGWLFGKGACWWLYGAPWLYPWLYYAWLRAPYVPPYPPYIAPWALYYYPPW